MTATNVTNYQSFFHSAIGNDFRTAVPHAFLSMFLQQAPTVDFGVLTTTIESWLNGRRIAPIVSRITYAQKENAPIMTPGQAGANEYLFGLVEQIYNVTVQNLDKRIPGESPMISTVNGEDIREQRAMYHTSKLAMESLKNVLRRLELMAIESFMSGEMTIGDVHQGLSKLVFPRSATLKNRTVEAVWSSASTANPWADFGAAQKEIIKVGGAVGNVNWISFMSEAAFSNLKAIYRSQATTIDTGFQGVVKDTDLARKMEDMPANLQFLIDGGMEYGGKIRSDFSGAYIHIFTYPSFYESDAGVITEYFTGNSVGLCAFNPEVFKSYFGSGRHWDTTGDGLAMIGVGNLPTFNADGLTVGSTNLPANVVHHTICPMPDKTGLAGYVEVSPIFANHICNMVATIDTATAS